MTEFSTRSVLDVAVSERSLSDARNKVESEMSRSVRPDIDPSVGGRNGRSGRRGVTDIFESQTELLAQIRDAIEQGSFANAGRGGGGATIISGGGRLGGIGSGLGTAGAVAAPIGAGYLLQDQLGQFSPMDLFEQQISPEMMFANALTGGGAGAAMGLGNILLGQSGDIGEALGLVEDAEAFEQSIVDSGRQLKSQILEGTRLGVEVWTQDVPQALADRPEWVSSLLTFTFNRPQWVANLFSYTLSRPTWLSDLTSFRLSEPEWVSDLRSLFSGGGGGGGPRAGARIPGSDVNVDATVSVDGSDLERALSRALRTRDVERFIVDTIRDELL